MKTKMTGAGSIKRVILIAVLCVTWGATGLADAQVASAPRAVVQAIQGDAYLTVHPDQKPGKLAKGNMVDAWNTISTNENGKLFLEWETGILNSLGGNSSIFLASRGNERGSLDAIEMTQGLLRVTRPSGGGAITPYMVVTPAASIEPTNYDEPVDFIVEVYGPTTAIITVISGNLRIKNLTLSRPTETVVSSCQTVYVEGGKDNLKAIALSSEDLVSLLDGTTIPGTIVASLDICPGSSPQQRAAEPSFSSGPRYSEDYQYADYQFEDWASYDIYPYDEIRVLQPRSGVGTVIDLPGVGRWIIPTEAFSGWRYDPDVIGNYARYIILDQIIYRDQYYLEDLRLQQQQYQDAVYLSQLSGDWRMMGDAQRQLEYVTIQEQWTARRLNRLQRNAARLQQEQKGLGNRLPRDGNLFQAVSHSFNSPQNLQMVQNFRQRIKTRRDVQAQMAGLAGRELTDIRSRVARERDPRKRLSLRNGLTKLNQDVAQGRLPTPAKERQVRQVVQRLANEQDTKKVQNLQRQLGRLTKTRTPQTVDILNQDKLASLKHNLAKFPNPHKRNDLQARVAKLGQSVEQRKRVENARQKTDSLTAQAAKQTDVRKRDKLLGRLKELGKARASGAAGKLNVLGLRHNLESQLAIERDGRKRALLRRALEDRRKKQAQLLPHEPVRGKQPEAVPRHKEDVRKQTERRRLEPVRQKHKQQQAEKALRRQKQQGEKKHRLQQQAEKVRKQQQQAEKALRRQKQQHQPPQKKGASNGHRG